MLSKRGDAVLLVSLVKKKKKVRGRGKERGLRREGRNLIQIKIRV